MIESERGRGGKPDEFALRALVHAPYSVAFTGSRLDRALAAKRQAVL